MLQNSRLSVGRRHDSFPRVLFSFVPSLAWLSPAASEWPIAEVARCSNARVSNLLGYAGGTLGYEVLAYLRDYGGNPTIQKGLLAPGHPTLEWVRCGFVPVSRACNDARGPHLSPRTPSQGGDGRPCVSSRTAGGRETRRRLFLHSLPPRYLYTTLKSLPLHLSSCSAASYNAFAVSASASRAPASSAATIASLRSLFINEMPNPPA